MAKTQIVRKVPRFSAAKAQLAKLQARSAAAARRTRDLANERKGVAIAAVAAAGIGYAEKSGYRLPTVAGIEPTLLLGGLAVLFSGKIASGNMRRMVDDIGAGALAVAGYKLGLGQPMLSGDDGTDQVSGGAGWENVP